MPSRPHAIGTIKTLNEKKKLKLILNDGARFGTLDVIQNLYGLVHLISYRIYNQFYKIQTYNTYIHCQAETGDENKGITS